MSKLGVFVQTHRKAIVRGLVILGATTLGLVITGKVLAPKESNELPEPESVEATDEVTPVEETPEVVE